MGWLLQDVRYGSRLFARTPSFALVAAAALALGIGTTTAIFSVVDAVLLQPLPFRDDGRLVVIYEKQPSANRFRLFAAPANLREWRAQSRAFVAMEAIQEGLHANISGGTGEPEELRVERVTAGLFPMLGVQPAVGRTFRPEEDIPGHNNYAVLSYALWQRRFGGDRSISGKPIRFREQSYTVLGVMPPRFAVLDSGVDIWVPLALNPNATGRSLAVIARLRSGATLDQARSELDIIGARLESQNRALDAGFRPSVFPLRDELVSFHDEKMGTTKKGLLTLLGAVGFLLLMTCVNIANLLLARGAARKKEIAIRLAAGATRGRIVGQLLTESLLLAIAGGAAGVALAYAALALTRWLGPVSIPRLSEVGVNGRLLLFAVAVSLGTGVAFGIVPALQAAGGNVNAGLLEGGGRGGTLGRAGRILRSLLAIVQVTLAVVLLIGAGLLIRSFTELHSVDGGIRSSGLLSFRLPLAGRANAAPERRIEFVQQVTDRIAALPGVSSAGAVSILPLTGFGSGSTFFVAGRPEGAPEQHPVALVRSVTPSYFSTMGIRLSSGRSIALSDTRESQPVAVVDETMVRRFLRDCNPVGTHLKLDQLGKGVVVEVVGVVGNVAQEKLGAEGWPTVYLPYSQWPTDTMVVVARTSGPPKALAGAAVREIHQMQPEQPVADIRTMREIVNQAIADSRFNAVVFGIFAGIAFVLAAIGIYGVISFGVTERTHELGIRMALGAQRADMLKLILKDGALLAAIGIALGLLAAWALTRFMAAMLFGVKPTDFYTFAAIALLLGFVALAASYVPSRRAMNLDPVNALRHE